MASFKKHKINVALSLKAYRKTKNITASQTAENLCISRSTYSGWENEVSVPSIQKLVYICEYYNVTLDEFLGLTPKPVGSTDFCIFNQRQAEKKKEIINLIHKL